MSVPDLCDQGTIRGVARRFGVGPRKSLGQNFLVDRSLRDRIAETVVATSSTVLEVGPGLGGLTQGLLQRGAMVVAVELDPKCIAALGLLTRAYPDRLRVVGGDILRTLPAQIGVGPDYVLAGNLPYQLTGALLPRLLDWSPAPITSHLVVQREVARRLAASGGDWSLATLAVRLVATVQVEFDLPPSSFWPAPKVQSSLISIQPVTSISIEVRQSLLALARPMFQARRKQLHHGLALALNSTPAEAASQLRKLGIDPERRPGTLRSEEWLQIAVLGAGRGSGSG